MVKFAFSCLLFCANIPTGLAIVRLFVYFFCCYHWILNIKFTLGIENNFECRYILHLRNSVLFTVVIYCTLSLSSILFTDLELNMLVLLYTIFAFILIISTMLLTNHMISHQRNYIYLKKLYKINYLINMNLYKKIYNNASNSSLIEEWFSVKEWLKRQANSSHDWSRFLSAIGMLLIAIIPILLQYILDKI